MKPSSFCKKNSVGRPESRAASRQRKVTRNSLKQVPFHYDVSEGGHHVVFQLDTATYLAVLAALIMDIALAQDHYHKPHKLG